MSPTVELRSGPSDTPRALELPPALHEAHRVRARVALRRRLLAADALAGAAAAVPAALAAGAEPAQLLVLVPLLAAVWVLGAFLGGLYANDDPPSWTAAVAETRRVASIALLLSWPALGLCALVGTPHAALGGAVAGSAWFLTSTASRGIARTLARRAIVLRQRTLIIGSGVVADGIATRLLNHPELGLEPVGQVDDDPYYVAPPILPHLGGMQELGHVLDVHRPDRVIVAFSRAGHAEIMACMRICWDRGVAIDVIPRLFELLDGARRVDRVGGVPVMAIDTPSLSGWARVAKRLFDIVVSALALLVLAPLLLLIALAIKLDSRGPVFFGQQRAGRRGEVFKLLKFRSMYSDAEERKAELERLNEHGDGLMFKMRRDPRVTRVGYMLRRSSLDELPQLFNVLAGRMSLVGPRPLIFAEHDRIETTWARRQDLRPGMTGPWQVYGRSELPFEDMLRYDYQYVAGWSLSRDLDILLATVPAVLSGRGAY